jgi:hypothetical protein
MGHKTRPIRGKNALQRTETAKIGWFCARIAKNPEKSGII